MTSVLDLDKHTRLLIVVPHPDDETLATGGLIQAALAVGASLRVVIVTDGDNNPWPQRWVEKRWHIDAQARTRWGTRRRHEAAAALARLGVAEDDVRHYGWPDQGLTGLLMCDAQREDELLVEIVDFAPTLVAAPSLADRHPDHSALRVMLELALARTVFDA
ncbi:MAG: PIG-L family deacetylase, partial [Dokdonella sp.]